MTRRVIVSVMDNKSRITERRHWSDFDCSFNDYSRPYSFRQEHHNSRNINKLTRTSSVAYSTWLQCGLNKWVAYHRVTERELFSVSSRWKPFLSSLSFYLNLNTPRSLDFVNEYCKQRCLTVNGWMNRVPLSLTPTQSSNICTIGTQWRPSWRHMYV